MGVPGGIGELKIDVVVDQDLNLPTWILQDGLTMNREPKCEKEKSLVPDKSSKHKR
jgi:hypothetical protein